MDAPLDLQQRRSSLNKQTNKRQTMIVRIQHKNAPTAYTDSVYEVKSYRVEHLFEHKRHNHLEYIKKCELPYQIIDPAFSHLDIKKADRLTLLYLDQDVPIVLGDCKVYITNNTGKTIESIDNSLMSKADDKTTSET